MRYKPDKQALLQEIIIYHLNCFFVLFGYGKVHHVLGKSMSQWANGLHSSILYETRWLGWYHVV